VKVRFTETAEADLLAIGDALAHHDPVRAVESGGTCGIVVAGCDAAGVVYVLADASVSGASPERWARAVAAAAEVWGADRVVAEKNQGGEMVGSVLRSADVALPVKLVSASRGKVARAEPVAALFEAGRAKLAGRFAELEDELAGLVIGGDYAGPGRSPDRADAMVWAVTALMRRSAEPSIRAL
jgi:phage terminase large subunit-like protein